MTFDEYLRRLSADFLVASADALEKRTPQILGVAAVATRKASSEIQQMTAQAIDSADFGWLGDRFKGTFISGINQAIVNFTALLVDQESVLLGLGIAAMREQAVSLGG